MQNILTNINVISILKGALYLVRQLLMRCRAMLHKPIMCLRVWTSLVNTLLNALFLNNLCEYRLKSYIIEN